MTIDPGRAETLRRAYHEDGSVVVRGVVDAALVARMSDHVDWLQACHPGLRGEDLGHQMVADDPFWLRTIADDRLVDLAEVFLGPDIALFASHYICKPPRSGRPVLWHQDAGYWPLDPMEVISLWVAVDPSTTENGCLRVVPGSHRDGVHSMRDRDDVASVFGNESAVAVDEGSAIDLVLDPGDVEIHHPNLLHSSGPNTSPVRRCGLTIRYIPTSTRIVADEQPYPSAFLLRGAPGVNIYQPYPVYDPARHFPFTTHWAPVPRQWGP
jgi:phytanoyl-CoA hydroxylase